MEPGGLLILSEKLTMADPAMDALMIDLHHDFKRSQGYSDLEIAQKRDAIDNVLIPETAQIHTARLADAGFSRSSIWFQCLNFASFIAIA
jgi:tRNA (cmo5U34)-methyltransferase